MIASSTPGSSLFDDEEEEVVAALDDDDGRTAPVVALRVGAEDELLLSPPSYEATAVDWSCSTGASPAAGRGVFSVPK